MRSPACETHVSCGFGHRIQQELVIARMPGAGLSPDMNGGGQDWALPDTGPWLDTLDNIALHSHVILSSQTLTGAVHMCKYTFTVCFCGLNRFFRSPHMNIDKTDFFELQQDWIRNFLSSSEGVLYVDTDQSQTMGLRTLHCSMVC